MTIQACEISYEALQNRDWGDQAIALVDLATLPENAAPPPLPPFPVVARGDPAHPAATWFDAVLEPPLSAEMLLTGASRHPQAAAVLVQLLRAIEPLPTALALPIESMAYGLLLGGGECARWLADRIPASMPAAPGSVHVQREDACLILTLDRPLAQNAIDVGMRDRLYEALMVALLDPSITRVALRGKGRAFSVGADLDEFGTTRDPALGHWIRSRTLPALLLAQCSDRLDVHIQGACVGSGLEMAAFARIVTAGPQAWFQLPEVGMGLLPGAGGCVSVSRRIGRGRALLLMLSGRRINAQTALRWGLVDRIENHDALHEGGKGIDPG
ncbi:MAG: enoyl-CoA hydratase [Sphingobium sp.]|nr:MAG: enoyl-CoA hydratase [Sphingobium sp.]